MQQVANSMLALMTNMGLTMLTWCGPALKGPFNKTGMPHSENVCDQP